MRQVVCPGRTANAKPLEGNWNAIQLPSSKGPVPAARLRAWWIEQSRWSEDNNVNPIQVFERPEASVEVTPNIVLRAQTDIAVSGSNFTPSAPVT